MAETFRLKKSLKYEIMIVFPIFLIPFAVSVVLMFLGDLKALAIGGLGLIVFGALVLLPIYGWSACYLERFTISGTTLSIRSVFQNRQFDVSQLEKLTWKRFPTGGHIVFGVHGAKARLDLGGYANDDRIRIIKSLHDLVPASVQEGWPYFCHMVALPLREGERFIAHHPASECLRITRRRYDRMAAFAIPISLVVAVTLWAWTQILQFLALPAVVVGAWLFLRSSVPIQGRAERRLTSSTDGWAILALGSAMPLPVLILGGLRLLGVQESTTYVILGVVLGTVALPSVYVLHKADKRRQIADEQAAISAPKRWDQGPSVKDTVEPTTP